MSERKEHRMGDFIALKSAIINGEEALVKKFMGNEPMLDVEKSYLVELAQLGNNPTIIKLLEDLPVKGMDQDFKA